MDRANSTTAICIPRQIPRYGNRPFARHPRRRDLALDPALAEAARDQDPVGALELLGVEVLGVDELDVDLDAVMDPAVLERLDHRLVGVFEADVLADQGDLHPAVGGVGAAHHRFPLGEVRGRRLHPEVVEDEVVDALGAEHQRHLVDVVDVVGRDHRVDREAREQRDLVADVAVEATLGAADQGVRLDPDPAQLVDRVLGRLRLQFTGVADVRHQRQVDEHASFRAEVGVELADRLEERQRLDVADGAADLGDHEVDRLRLGDDQDPVLDLVGDVRDHLDRGAEVVAAALALDHRVVDRARGDVRRPRCVFVGESLVVAEVEVGLGAILGDEHLAMLERAHRPRVDVDVGIELLKLDPIAAGDEQPADRGGGDSLAESRDHSAGYEDESRISFAAHALPSESNQRKGGNDSTVVEIERISP